MLEQNFDQEKENIRREERRRFQLEMDKVRSDNDSELKDARASGGVLRPPQSFGAVLFVAASTSRIAQHRRRPWSIFGP